MDSDIWERQDIMQTDCIGNLMMHPSQCHAQASAEELSVNGFRTVMEIDAIGTFATSRAAFSALQQHGGSIVNISATLHYGATWWQVPHPLICLDTSLPKPALQPAWRYNLLQVLRQQDTEHPMY